MAQRLIAANINLRVHASTEAIEAKIAIYSIQPEVAID